MKTIEDKIRQNQKAPISRLPPELFSLIFCQLRDRFFTPVSQDLYGFFDPYEPLQWTIVTKVCHAWRMTALNTPPLWAHILLSSYCKGRWAQEMCRLSRQMPLHIIVFWTNPMGHEIMNHLGRCHTLVLNNVNCVPLDEILPNIQVYGSRLEFLLIIGIPYIPILGLRPTTFDGALLHAKSLRRLSIDGCHIIWESNLPHFLTHLTLKNVVNSCPDFVAFLSNIPALESLHLPNFSMGNHVPLPTPDTRKTRLRNLKFLCVSCAIDHMAGFLCRLDLASSCRLSLETRDGAQYITPALGALLSWFAYHYRPSPSSMPSDEAEIYFVRSLSLHHSDPFFTAKGFGENLSYDGVPNVREPLFEITIMWRQESLRWSTGYEDPIIINDTILQPCLSLLPLEHLTYLAVSHNKSGLSISEEIWSMVFGSIRTIEKIFLDSDPVPFLCALIPDPKSLHPRPLPALSSIACNDSIDITSVLACLQARSEAGLALQEFLFPEGWTISDTTVTLEELEKVVSHVGFHSCKIQYRDEELFDFDINDYPWLLESDD